MNLDPTYAEACRDRIRKHLDALRLYQPNSIQNPLHDVCKGDHKLNVSIVPLDVVSATIQLHIKYPFKRIGVLNFASYKTPGGGFMRNKFAQEEALCYCTNLYDALSEQYDWYSHPKNNGMYGNQSILSYCVAVVASEMDKFLPEEEIFYVSVLTCAAPNLSYLNRYKAELLNEGHKAARERVRYLMNVFARTRHETLVLGAFGCGVFGNDPHEIAQAFKESLAANAGSFENVVFAIPKGADGNYEAFMEVFDERDKGHNA